MDSPDITELLYRIKENITAVENGDVFEAVLKEIERDYLELIELLKLFMISERDSYYGYFMLNMQFRANCSSRSIAGIKLNEFPPVFEGNPLLFCKFTLKEMIYIMCHEIEHVILNHPAEMVNANPDKDPDTFYLFNLAADAAVNERLNHEIKAEKHYFMKAPEGIITSSVLKEKFHLNYITPLENYAYYFELIRDAAEEQQDPEFSFSDNGQNSIMGKQNQRDGVSPDGNGLPGDDNPDLCEDSNGDNQSRGGVVTAVNSGGKLTDHNWEAGNDGEDAAAAVREFVNAAVDMMNNETRGLMPGHFMEDVEKINQPPVISWQSILKKYVGTISANKKKTRTRLNRRQPQRFDLSGTKDDKVLKIVVALDTSGSVSDDMIARIFNEIFAILARRKHDITVIECDAEVQRVYKARNDDDIQQKVTGRGGTMFTPVIDYINNDKYFRDALLIYFTDGYGEWEIPRPRTYRNIWAVFDSVDNLSIREPYGVVVAL